MNGIIGGNTQYIGAWYDKYYVDNQGHMHTKKVGAWYDKYYRDSSGQIHVKGKITGSGDIGQWLAWPTGGQIVAYSGYGPNAQPLGIYIPGAAPGGAATSGSGSIGVVTNIITDANNGTWYMIDTSNGAVPASQNFPNVTSNTIFVPGFGDTTNADNNNLTADQKTANGSSLLFSNSSGTGGAGLLPIPGKGNLNKVEKGILWGFGLLLGAIVVTNIATR